MRVIAGCDGGGTKCEVRLIVYDDSDAVLSEGASTTGSANVTSNPELALESIRQATREAMALAGVAEGIEIDSFVAALAGAGTAALHEEWTRRLSELLPVRSIQVVPDVSILFAAADVQGKGVATIIGTGSIAWARCGDGRLKRAGGLGPNVGDEGSGFWIGKQVVLSLQKSGSQNQDFASIVDRCFGDQRPQLNQTRECSSMDASRIAALSENVFEIAGHVKKAQEIVSSAADHIADMICSACSEIQTSELDPLLWVAAGGVACHQRNWMQEIGRRCKSAGVVLSSPHLVEHPVLGALELARSSSMP